MYNLIVLSALIPVAALAFFAYYQDRNKPEPKGQLVKAFFFGVASIAVSLCISLPLGWLGVYQDEPAGVIEAVKTAFFGAAIPEEIAKFLMLWLLLRKNRFFDEHMDGIVYGAYVSLGFAAFENIGYLLADTDTLVSTWFMRAIFAVPSHFCYGVIMGYYYSLIRFSPELAKRSMALVLLVPILMHGIYDAILMSLSSMSTAMIILLFVLWMAFCVLMWRIAYKRIKKHLQRDFEEDRVGFDEA